MILENCSSLESYFVRFIMNAFHNLKDGEFKSVFKSLPCECTLRISSATDLVYDELFLDHKGHMTKKYIANKLERCHFKEFRTSMQTVWCFMPTSTGTLELKELYLDINVVSINKLILDNIWRLDFLKELLHNSLRHEIGHMIDVGRFHGKTVAEYMAYADQCTRELNEYYDWLMSDEDTGDWMSRLERYYSITNEKAANDLVGIHIDDILRFEDPSKRKHGLTIEISVVEDNNDNR